MNFELTLALRALFLVFWEFKAVDHKYGFVLLGYEWYPEWRMPKSQQLDPSERAFLAVMFVEDVLGPRYLRLSLFYFEMKICFNQRPVRKPHILDRVHPSAVMGWLGESRDWPETNTGG